MSTTPVQSAGLRTRLVRLLPFGAAAVLVVTLAVPFSRVPLSFIDVYSNLSLADDLSWSATLGQAFRAGVEYRPLMTIANKLAWETIGLDLWIYRAIVLLEFAGILVVLVRLFRPTRMGHAIAAIIALMCLAGLHSSRILFNFNPLNGGDAVLLAILLTAAWSLDARTARWNALFFPLVIGACLTLESGLLFVPVLGALWLARAPGITTRGVAAAALGAAVYVAIHLGFGAPLAVASHTHSGLGFGAATAERLDATFGDWLWLYWIYNVASTVFTVAFSEPREGTYVFLDALLHATPPAWMWLHVVGSVATTVLIVAAFPRGGMTVRERVNTALGVALILGGSALGFLYTRDRIAMPVGIGYAVLLYVALSRFLSNASATAVRKAAATTVVAALAAVWLVRDAELYWFLRDLAWDYRSEWSDRYDAIRNDQPPTDLMLVLRALALEDTPPAPGDSPPWTNLLLERKFSTPNRDPDS